MPEKLKRPANQEQTERPPPIEEEERQRNDNQRNANTVRQFIERMPVLSFVVFDK